MLSLVTFLPLVGALAILLADDYRDAGVPMLPVVVGNQQTAWWILGNSIALVVSSLLPVWLGLLGSAYGIAAAIAGAILLGFNVVLVKNPSRRWAGWNFAASMPYLLLLFIGVFVDKHW